MFYSLQCCMPLLSHHWSFEMPSEHALSDIIYLTDTVQHSVIQWSISNYDSEMPKRSFLGILQASKTLKANEHAKNNIFVYLRLKSSILLISFNRNKYSVCLKQHQNFFSTFDLYLYIYFMNIPRSQCSTIVDLWILNAYVSFNNWRVINLLMIRVSSGGETLVQYMYV